VVSTNVCSEFYFEFPNPTILFSHLRCQFRQSRRERMNCVGHLLKFGASMCDSLSYTKRPTYYQRKRCEE